MHLGNWSLLCRLRLPQFGGYLDGFLTLIFRGHDEERFHHYCRRQVRWLTQQAGSYDHGCCTFLWVFFWASGLGFPQHVFRRTNQDMGFVNLEKYEWSQSISSHRCSQWFANRCFGKEQQAPWIDDGSNHGSLATLQMECSANSYWQHLIWSITYR